MQAKFKKIGLIGKHTVAKHLPLVKKIIRLLEKRGREILLDGNIDKALHGKITKALKKSHMMATADLIVVLGGDGTLLKLARYAHKKQVLVLGVNVGHLGFLTETTPNKASAVLEKILHGKYVIDPRELLRVTIYRNGRKKHTTLAMNEAVINQGGFSRLINLLVEINQRKLAHYIADGLIISTPTGSTAHALSAGGPIVHPRLEGIILTPLCPMKLGFRPIVIPNNRQITIKLETRWRAEKKPIVLTIDGQVTYNLQLGDIVKIRKSSRSFYLVRATGKKYYKMLRQKLNWGA